MGAKHKLNAAYTGDRLLIAGLLGWTTGSVEIFIVALAVLLVLSWYSGELRG